MGIERRVFHGAKSTDGPREVLGIIDKAGFESMLSGKGFWAYVYVEALGREGKVMGRSKEVNTWVPPPVDAKTCSELMCQETLHLEDFSDSYHGDGRGVRLTRDQIFLG